MEEYTVKRLALIYSIQAEIEAMKLQNSLHPNDIQNLGYTPDEFFKKAEELKDLAYVHNLQLFENYGN